VVFPAHGLARQWYESGQFEKEANFKEGKRISVKEWDEEGNLLKDETD
jgi:antitoxin component YwqK of YwqJK toxin-antitoxin module